MPQIATGLCILLIIYLFWVDRKNTENSSIALWVPFIWMFLSGSRYASQWLDLGAPVPDASVEAGIEGSPIDLVVFTILILASLYILYKRHVDWSQFFRRNVAVWLFFAFAVLSILWSDFPFVCMKRVIKGLGTVMIALVILTEEQPHIGIGVVLRRLAFVLLPLSVLFIRFYPDLGRAYDAGGISMYTGVGSQKNALGQLCLITGLYFSWNIFLGRRNCNWQKLHYSIYIVILPMIVWLLYMSHSATALVCMLCALSLFALARRPAFISEPRKIITFCTSSAVLIILLELVVGIKGTAFALLGRSSDFTGRAAVWDKYLAMAKDPIVGYGYEMFYTSVIAKGNVEEFASTHNGYLEMYLNLGIIGLLFVLGWIITGIRNVWKSLLLDYSASMLRLAIIFVALLNNWTESVFAGTSNMWVLLFVAIIVPPEKMAFQSGMPGSNIS